MWRASPSKCLIESARHFKLGNDTSKESPMWIGSVHSGSVTKRETRLLQEQNACKRVMYEWFDNGDTIVCGASSFEVEPAC